MNEITVIQPTMTSVEIVDLVNASRKERSLRTGRPFRAVRHDNAKRVIDSCVDSGVITFPQIEETSFIGSDGRRQTVTVHILDKRSAIIVTAQLSPEFTAAIVDRLDYLEQKLNLRHPEQDQALLTMDAIPEVKHTVMVIRDAQRAILKLAGRNARCEFTETIERVMRGELHHPLEQEADLLLARLQDYYENGAVHFNAENGFIQNNQRKWKCEPQLSYKVGKFLALSPKVADRENPAGTSISVKRGDKEALELAFMS